MNTSLKGMKAISLPDGIYIVGGFNGITQTNQFLK
jgi:hypothetical protein